MGLFVFSLVFGGAIAVVLIAFMIQAIVTQKRTDRSTLEKLQASRPSPHHAGKASQSSPTSTSGKKRVLRRLPG